MLPNRDTLALTRRVAHARAPRRQPRRHGAMTYFAPARGDWHHTHALPSLTPARAPQMAPLSVALAALAAAAAASAAMLPARVTTCAYSASDLAKFPPCPPDVTKFVCATSIIPTDGSCAVGTIAVLVNGSRVIEPAQFKIALAAPQPGDSFPEYTFKAWPGAAANCSTVPPISFSGNPSTPPSYASCLSYEGLSDIYYYIATPTPSPTFTRSPAATKTRAKPSGASATAACAAAALAVALASARHAVAW